MGDELIMLEGYIRLPELADELQISVRRLQQIIKENGEQLPGKVVRMGHKGTWISPEACNYISAVVVNGKLIDLQIENSLLGREKERLEYELDQLKMSQGNYDLEFIEILTIVLKKVKTIQNINQNISKSRYWTEIISPLVEKEFINREQEHF